MLEVLTSIRRAGADGILTYHAMEAARVLGGWRRLDTPQPNRLNAFERHSTGGARGEARHWARPENTRACTTCTYDRKCRTWHPGIDRGTLTNALGTHPHSRRRARASRRPDPTRHP